MPERRRNVLDTSVVVPFLFPDEDLKHIPGLRRRAQIVLAAVYSRRIVTSAPDLLAIEVMSVGRRLISGRGGSGMQPGDVLTQLDLFFDLRIAFVPTVQLREEAWRLVLEHRLSLADAMHLACARYYDAELWISHDHADGFVGQARAARCDVHVLANERFPH